MGSLMESGRGPARGLGRPSGRGLESVAMEPNLDSWIVPMLN